MEDSDPLTATGYWVKAMYFGLLGDYVLIVVIISPEFAGKFPLPIRCDWLHRTTSGRQQSKTVAALFLWVCIFSVEIIEVVEEDMVFAGSILSYYIPNCCPLRFVLFAWLISRTFPDNK